MASALQHGTMYADIAILHPIADMWSTLGMQNEPFPLTTNVKYKTLVWEAIHKNGSGCDYVPNRSSGMRDERRLLVLWSPQI